MLLPEGASLGEQRLDRRQERLLDRRTKRQGSLNIGVKAADIDGLLLNSRRCRWLLHEPERFKELCFVSQDEGAVCPPAPWFGALRAATLNSVAERRTERCRALSRVATGCTRSNPAFSGPQCLGAYVWPRAHLEACRADVCVIDERHSASVRCCIACESDALVRP